MTIIEMIAASAGALPVSAQREVLNFSEFLRMKEEKALDSAMDNIIAENMEALEELAK